MRETGSWWNGSWARDTWRLLAGESVSVRDWETRRVSIAGAMRHVSGCVGTNRTVFTAGFTKAWD